MGQGSREAAGTNSLTSRWAREDAILPTLKRLRPDWNTETQASGPKTFESGHFERLGSLRFVQGNGWLSTPLYQGKISATGRSPQ
jgi:hypothetical protein